MVADIAYRDPKGNNHNPHAHIMLTMRPFTRSGTWRAQKGREWNGSDLYCGWRESWARTTNAHLERAGFDARIDHRSYKEQGIERIPTVHLGKDATALERAGVLTEKGNLNRTVRACNELTELGVEPDGLLGAIREIGQRVRERQREGRKARAAQEREAAAKTASRVPSTEKTPTPGRVPRHRAVSGGSVPVRRDDQRRTDTSLRDVCDRGDPCTPERVEGAPPSTE